MALTSIQEDTPDNDGYPGDPKSYQHVYEIGGDANATVYKANCLSGNSEKVAIKVINLDRLRKEVSVSELVRKLNLSPLLPFHPNILRPHCAFTFGRFLFVVMPFIAAGSIQSIASSIFQENGLPRLCLARILKETLHALKHLHDQGQVHSNIKAGNILIDSDGSVKLAHLAVTPCMLKTEVVAGYWIAPEVTELQELNRYNVKTDIWQFGVTALELAFGRPPLSRIPPSGPLIKKMVHRFRFSDWEMIKRDKEKECFSFSKSFENLVNSCLQEDPFQRPSTQDLLNHPFFKNCSSSESLIDIVLKDLPGLEERKMFDKSNDFNDGGYDSSVYAWNFNADTFEIDPVFVEGGCERSQRLKVDSSRIISGMIKALNAMQHMVNQEDDCMMDLINFAGRAQEDFAKKEGGEEDEGAPGNHGA